MQQTAKRAATTARHRKTPKGTVVKRLACLLLAGTAIAVSGGCAQPGRSYVADVDPQGWGTGTVLTLPNDDTLTMYDLEIFLRCNDRFAEDTLTLRIETITPDSLHVEEFLHVPFPQSQTPAAVARETKVPYRRRVLLRQSGDYRMILTPTRRVRGVEAVGATLQHTP